MSSLLEAHERARLAAVADCVEAAIARPCRDVAAGLVLVLPALRA